MTIRARAAAVSSALLLASCRAEQSVFAPRGPAAERLAQLGGWVIGTFLVVALVMFVLLFWVATRNRGTLDEHAPADAGGGGHRWIYIGGFAVPAVVLAIFFTAALRTMSAFPLHEPRDDEHADHPADILVTAHQWWWEAEYTGEKLCGPARAKAVPPRMITANELHIPVGLPVEIALRSADVIHSFWVPQLHGKVDVVPGQENRIRLLATRPGRYRGQCAEFCGEQHARMALYVIADGPREFDRWMTNQKAPARAAMDEEQRHGLEVVETQACSLCHTIRGTHAQGTIGPDLTHVGSRRTIAAGSYPNTHAWLSAWVTHAQSLKPGSQMPDMTSLSGEDLHAVSHYLRHLE